MVVVVVRIAFFLSHLHCCNCCNMYMVIGSWASLHTHTQKKEKERKRKERKKKMVDSDAAAIV